MPTGNPLIRNFFKLEGEYTDLDQASFMVFSRENAKLCENRLYRPDTLQGQYRTGHQRIKGVTFRNVSFSRTEICGFEFNECAFERCLFISTIFRNCRFNLCSFIDCNPYRLEFGDCYVNPASFENCILDRQYSNIATTLFQELLRNSRQQAQPEFSDEALHLFRKWQRCLAWRELRGGGDWSSKWRAARKLAWLHVFEFISGSGVRLGKLIRFAGIVILLFSLANWRFAMQFGLTQNGKLSEGFINAVYFSTVVMTTLGLGDITPATALGRLAVSFEAMAGFVLFALVTSTMYHKFSQ